jgi:hypothetical protein
MLRVALVTVIAFAMVVLLVLLIGRGEEPGTPDALDRAPDAPAGPPTLKGYADSMPPLGTGAGGAARDAPGAGLPEALADELVEVLDYRGAGVAGAEVFHEVDVWDDPAFGPGERWKTLAQGTTGAKGQVHLRVDRNRRPPPGEGLNHRLRVVPPKERDDLSPSWRLWTPANREIYRMSQTHVVEGRVLDEQGEPVWQAVVWVGDLPERDTKVNDPGWRKTQTDPDGHFRFAGIPTTADWRIDVWALAPWAEAPRSSAQVRGAQSVALDERHVEIRLR